MDQSQNEVFAFLQHLDSRSPVQRIDTHANVIFLTDSCAYKVKRSVSFPFLDYSALALREAACKAEISCNKANAPQIYRRALPVTRSEDGQLALNGPGDPVEWVVEMTRFDRRNELDALAHQGPLADSLSDALARMMAAAHEAAPVRDGGAFHAELTSYLDQNDVAFHAHPDLFPAAEVKALTARARALLEDLRPLILKRGEQGLVRRCHGDAHTRNIVLIDGAPVLFDAVEFSDAIATGDLLYDLAFLLMDLWERGQKRAANRVFNRYLDLSRLDHTAEGIAALPFYLMMRAAIRAKIAASAALAQSDPAQKEGHRQEAGTYFRFALAFLEPSQPCLTAIGGLSGTGKTTLSYGLAPELGRAPGARVLRTDVMRKRLLNMSETEKAPATAYTKEASNRVYKAMDSEIQAVLATGQSAIFDAVFAAEAERSKIQAIALTVDAAFAGLWLEAPAATLKDRVAARAGDASDATVEIVDQQLGYDLGTLTWPRIEAGGGRALTLDRARDVLRPRLQSVS